MADAPEVHPTSYVRNTMNIAALRLMGHGNLADELEARFHGLRPASTHIIWRLGSTLEVASIPVGEMDTAAEIAADFLMNEKLDALEGRSYGELATFTAEDQVTVEAVVPLLVDGDPTFMEAAAATPRHALAATVFAFEAARGRANTINRTFKHFV